MKKQFWKQPAGALAAIALVVMGGAGVYAATNWFGGSVKVTTDSSILTVDLSGCASALPAGIEQDVNRKEVKFKILGTPHIEAKELEQRLLADCEWQTVQAMYTSQFGEIFARHFGTVKEINPAAKTITLAYSWASQGNVRTFPLKDGATFYDKGQPVDAAQLKPGDMVTFVYDLSDQILEGEDPFERITAIKSVFKMQYDPGQSLSVTKAFYTESNIMPLDHYNQLNKK